MSRPGFRGGIHPADHKAQTRDVPIERAPVPERVVIPMSQHLGAPCQPTVAVGDRVARGQVVGDVDAMVSAPVHSPVAGEVSSIGPRLLATGVVSIAVEIAADAEQDLGLWMPLAGADDVRDVIRAAGVVGMGGAAFPTRVKLTPPKDMPVSTVILNGCECELFLTCDHRLMLERPHDVLEGAAVIREAAGASRVVVGVEDNKPDAAEALRSVAADDVEIRELPTHYPQGAEKQLIWATIGKEVPHGKLPAATGALVHNVGTAVAVADAVAQAKPLIERVVTVSGAVARPGNFLTLIGTPFATLLDAAGGVTRPDARVIAGGPMTGFAVADLDVPVVKGTSGIVVLGPEEIPPYVEGDQPCIRCGRCADACPMFLLPYAIGVYADRRLWDDAERFHALDCIECGCCSYVCPTRRPLVQLIRLAKRVLMDKGVKP